MSDVVSEIHITIAINDAIYNKLQEAYNTMNLVNTYQWVGKYLDFIENGVIPDEIDIDKIMDV